MKRQPLPKDNPSREEMEVLRRKTYEILAREVIAVTEKYGIDLRAIIRFRPVAARCKQRREKSGLTIRLLAAALGIQQYRIRAIESGSIHRINPEDLLPYMKAIGFEKWFRRWFAANADLFSKK